MLTNVINAVVTALQGAGISAGSAWPKAALQRGDSFVAVGVERAEDCAGGFARYLGVDPTLVRVAAVVGAVFSLGVVVVAYVATWILMPEL